MSFGAALRAARARRGISQNALARASGLNVGTVNRLERDQRLPTGAAQVARLAAALGLAGADLDRLLHAAGLPCARCAAGTERAARARDRYRRWRAA